MTERGNVMDRVRLFEGGQRAVDTTTVETSHNKRAQTGNSASIYNDQAKSQRRKESSPKIETRSEEVVVGRSDDKNVRDEADASLSSPRNIYRDTLTRTQYKKLYVEDILSRNAKLDSNDDVKWPSSSKEVISNLPTLSFKTGANTLPAASSYRTEQTQVSTDADTKSDTSSTTSIASRLRSLNSRSPAWVHSINPELKRNLDAASVILQVEKTSSVGSSSSSKSSLSNKELNKIAQKALKLSRISSETRTSRMENSPLTQMLKQKRNPKIALEGASVENRTTIALQGEQKNASELPSPSTIGITISSSRMSRAERFAALKRHNLGVTGTSSFQPNSDDSVSSENVTRTHPVFSHPKVRNHVIAKRRQMFENEVQSASLCNKDSVSPLTKAESATPNTPSSYASSDQNFNSRSRLSRTARAKYLKGSLERSRILPTRYKNEKWEPDSIDHSERKTFVTKNLDIEPFSEMKLKESLIFLKAQALGAQHSHSTEEGPESKSIESDDMYEELIINENHTSDGTSRDRSNDQLNISSGESASATGSELAGEDIQHISSNDASTMNRSSWKTKSTSRDESTHESKMSSGESNAHTSKLLEPIPDEEEELENTLFSYTESHSSPEAVNLESHSSSSKPEALKWWQKNYGKKVNSVTNEAVRDAFVKTKESLAKNMPIQKIPEDDEEDVFSGLEDDFHHPSENGGSSGYEGEGTQSGDSAKKAQRQQEPLGLTSRGINIIDPSIQPISSDNRSTFLSGIRVIKPLKSPRGGVDTIKEEPDEEENVENCTIEENTGFGGYDENEDTVIDTVMDLESDEKLGKEKSAFLNLGCGFVYPFADVCPLPDQIRDHTKCDNGKCIDKTKQGADECVQYVKKRAEDYTNRDAETVDGTNTYYTYGEDTKEGNTTMHSLNEEEIKAWKNWSDKDELSIKGVSVPQKDSESTSINSSLLKTDQNQAQRRQAQKKLMKHAQRALAAYGNLESDATISSSSMVSALENKSSKVNQGILRENPSVVKPKKTPEPIIINKPEEDSVAPAPASLNSLATNYSVVEREMLSKFSARMRYQGIKVLKLNRKNQWQQRFLTVSNEETWIESDDVGGIGQCPRALLWLKHFKANKNGVALLRDNGRGGFMFSHLNIVELSRDVPDGLSIPKRWQNVFPTFHGVRINYTFVGGSRTLLFCFQTKEDTEHFCTTIRIIRDVVRRKMAIKAALQKSGDDRGSRVEDVNEQVKD